MADPGGGQGRIQDLLRGGAKISWRLSALRSRGVWRHAPPEIF